MNALTKSLAKDLKLLLKKFPNKASINLYEAKEYMSKTLNISIDLLDDNLIDSYLKQKGYKEIVKNKRKVIIKELEKEKIDPQKVDIEKNNFDVNSFDLDMDLDSLLDFDLSWDDESFNFIDIEKVDINYKNSDYSNNKELLYEHTKTKNPIILNELMINNKSLVYKYASFYNRMIAYNSSLDEEDLVQAGMLGLYKAIHRYNIDKGAQFSTYAVFWIKQAITREIMNNGNVVRLPVHLGQDLLKLNRLESESIFKFGHVNMDYICEKMNITESKYNSLKEIDYKFSKMKSIDLHVNEENTDTSIIDLLDSKNALVNLSDDFLDPLEISVKNIFNQNLLKCLDRLTEREKDILLLRFGFIDGTPHTLEDIGLRYNVTRERIRQIEAKALQKLKKSKSVRQLLRDEDKSTKNKKKPISKINTLKETSNVNNYNTKLSSNKINMSSNKVAHNIIDNKLKDIKNTTRNRSNTSNKKSTIADKKIDIVKNTKVNNINKSTIKSSTSTSSKNIPIKGKKRKYNINSFKKEVSKGFFTKLKSRYNGEYLLAEEYSQIALSVKIYHTKCGNEFYTKSSTLLSKRPPCPICEYKEYIASKK